MAIRLRLARWMVGKEVADEIVDLRECMDRLAKIVGDVTETQKRLVHADELTSDLHDALSNRMAGAVRRLEKKLDHLERELRLVKEGNRAWPKTK